jgi:hypothetical protein
VIDKPTETWNAEEKTKWIMEDAFPLVKTKWMLLLDADEFLVLSLNWSKNRLQELMIDGRIAAVEFPIWYVIPREWDEQWELDWEKDILQQRRYGLQPTRFKRGILIRNIPEMKESKPTPAFHSFENFPANLEFRKEESYFLLHFSNASLEEAKRRRVTMSERLDSPYPFSRHNRFLNRMEDVTGILSKELVEYQIRSLAAFVQLLPGYRMPYE